MTKLPDATALGARPAPQAARNTGDFSGLGNPPEVAAYGALRYAANDGHSPAEAARAIKDVASQLQKAQEATNARQDVLQRIDAMDAFDTYASSEFERLQTEGDYSQQATADQFYQGLKGTSDELLNSYVGTADGKATLQAALAERRAFYGRQSANAMITAQRQKISNRVESIIGHYAKATADTPGAIDQNLVAFSEEIKSLAPGLTPQDHYNAMKVGGETIASSAIYNRISSGDYTGAAQTMDKLPDGLLSPGTYNQLRREITLGMAKEGQQRNPWQQRVDAFSQVMGRPPTSAETANMFGASRTDPTDQPPKVQAIVDGDKILYKAWERNAQTGKWELKQVDQGAKPQTMQGIMQDLLKQGEAKKPAGGDNGGGAEQGSSWWERALHIFSDTGGEDKVSPQENNITSEDMRNAAPGGAYTGPDGLPYFK